METAHPFYTRNMPHTVTRWPRGISGGDGRPTFGAPTLLSCRWQYEQNVVRDDRGNEITCEVVAYLAGDVDEGDFLALGNHSGSASPVDGIAKEVRRKKLSPDLSGSKQLLKAWL